MISLFLGSALFLAVLVLVVVRRVECVVLRRHRFFLPPRKC